MLSCRHNLKNLVFPCVGVWMQRFYYTAVRDLIELDGIIRADSIDIARERLLQQGFEEITLSILSSSDIEIDDSPGETDEFRSSV